MNHLEDIFPLLQSSDYKFTSAPSDSYNCISWAVGSQHSGKWWWPFGDPDKTHWPPEVERAETLTAFQKLFAALGFVDCEGDGLEAGFEKIAVFADEEGCPLHAARQLPTGKWTSKIGAFEDIEHDLYALVGTEYGSVAFLMRRLSRESRPDD